MVRKKGKLTKPFADGYNNDHNYLVKKGKKGKWVSEFEVYIRPNKNKGFEKFWQWGVFQRTNGDKWDCIGWASKYTFDEAVKKCEELMQEFSGIAYKIQIQNQLFEQ